MTTFQGCTSQFCDTVIIPNTIGYEEYAGGISAVNVYPNPSSYAITVNYTLADAQDVTIEIVDLSGRVVMTRTENGMQAGAQRTEIALGEIAAGSYVLRVRTAGGEARLPFVRE